MEKRLWENPLTMVQQFMPNEYVAACGDKNEVYKFRCDAGGGESGTVWVDSNNNGRWDLIGDELLTSPFGILESYHACGETHEASTSSEFLNGFYLPSANPVRLQKVIIWTDGGTNIHCTTNLDKDSWETAKS